MAAFNALQTINRDVIFCSRWNFKELVSSSAALATEGQDAIACLCFLFHIHFLYLKNSFQTSFS